MNTFKCEHCNHIFKTEGTKKEWKHPLYGKSWKRIAKCPKCKQTCDEYIDRGTLKKSSGSSSSSGSSCATGTCPFV